LEQHANWIIGSMISLADGAKVDRIMVAPNMDVLLALSARCAATQPVAGELGDRT
jgi:hypothetical protein